VPKDIVTILLVLLVGVVGMVVSGIVLGIVLGLVPFLGPVLVAIGGALMQSAFFAFFLGVGVYFYFTLRRRFEGGDPEAEGRAALGGVASLPQ
jgi:predicted membrane-bound dolichyl-phosphate-mannose-protein mannosyltransferase